MAAGKMKTRKAVSKRVRRTATGKLMRAKASRGHLLSCKSRKRKRHLRAGGTVSDADYCRINACLPNG